MGGMTGRKGKEWKRRGDVRVKKDRGGERKVAEGRDATLVVFPLNATPGKYFAEPVHCHIVAVSAADALIYRMTLTFYFLSGSFVVYRH